jgi:hypothetical protein
MADLPQKHHFDGREEEEEDEEEEEEEEWEDVEATLEDEQFDGSDLEDHHSHGGLDPDRKACIIPKAQQPKSPSSSLSSSRAELLISSSNPRSWWNEGEIDSLITAMERYSEAIAASRLHPSPPPPPSASDNVSHGGCGDINDSSNCHNYKDPRWTTYLEHMHSEGFTEKTENQVCKKVQNLNWSFRHLKAWKLGKRLPLYEDLSPPERNARRLPRHFTPSMYARMETIFSNMGLKYTTRTTTKYQPGKVNRIKTAESGKPRVRNRLLGPDSLVTTGMDLCPGDVDRPPERRITRAMLMKQRKVTTNSEMDVDNEAGGDVHRDSEDPQREEEEDGDGDGDAGSDGKDTHFEDVVDDDECCFQGQPHSNSDTKVIMKEKDHVSKGDRCMVLEDGLTIDADDSMILEHVAETGKQLSDFIHAVKMNMEMVRTLMESRKRQRRASQ